MTTDTRYRVVDRDGHWIGGREITTRDEARHKRAYWDRMDPGAAPHRVQKAVIEWKDIR